MILPKPSGRYAPVIVLASVYLALSALLRLVLWIAFGMPEGTSASLLPGILAVGLMSDLIALVYMTFPFVVYLYALPTRCLASRLNQALVATLSYLLIFGMIYLCAVEYFFFEEFDSRFNLVAVDYLIYPNEVFVNLWESYPIVWYLCSAAFFSLLIYRLLRPFAALPALEAPAVRRSPAVFTQIAAIAVLGLAFPAGRFEFSENRIAVEIGNNGIIALINAFNTQELDFPLYYRTIPEDKAFALVRSDLAESGGRFLSDNPRDLNRVFPAKPGALGRMNIVVLCQESLGSGFLGAFGGRKDLTPNLDALARKSLVFTNLYASGSRTVRGLEAISASFPPIPSVSILRRPGSENIATIGQVMHSLGYHTSFLYGGYGIFDNMNHVFESNGFAISDRTDIPAPRFGNIWGVADQDLYDHALTYFDRLREEGKPFFSLVMSTSNHKPYTFPEGVPGIPASGGGREAGVRYADFAIDEFLEKAEAHPWFNNTVFVVIADHDARVYGRQEVPVKRYEIPLIIYAPGKIAPRVVDKQMSQIDLGPTLLGLLGLEYTAPFFGRDALSSDSPSPVFINHNHDVAYLAGDNLVVFGLGQTAKTFRYSRETGDLTRHDLPPAFIDLANAYYQTAFQVFNDHQYKLPGQAD